MDYDLSNENQIYLFDKQVAYIRENKKLCKLEVIKKKRTITQNKALHLYFNHISKELNNLGLTFNYTGLKGVEMEMRYNSNLVKEMIWRPIQITLFGKESTTELTTQEINEVLDVLSKFFNERGVYIPFPSIQSLIDYNNG
jgi:hypothetical protein